MAAVLRANVQSNPLDVAEIEGLVDTANAGAFVSFVGKVRAHDAGRGVEALEYSSHPTAHAETMRIAEEVLGNFEGVLAIAVTHRVGSLRAGEVAIVCAVAAGHRGQAFSACRELVERIKAELPIWKHQIFKDGTDEWVGSA